MKNLEYLKAWVNSEEVQFYSSYSGKWIDILPTEKMEHAHLFGDSLKYRIKPKPVEIVEYLIYSPSTETTYWVAKGNLYKSMQDFRCWDAHDNFIKRTRVVYPE